MVKDSIEAFNKGDYKTTDEVLKELKSSPEFKSEDEEIPF